MIARCRVRQAELPLEGRPGPVRPNRKFRQKSGQSPSKSTDERSAYNGETPCIIANDLRGRDRGHRAHRMRGRRSRFPFSRPSGHRRLHSDAAARGNGCRGGRGRRYAEIRFRTGHPRGVVDAVFFPLPRQTDPRGPRREPDPGACAGAHPRGPGKPQCSIRCALPERGCRGVSLTPEDLGGFARTA